MGVLFLGLLVVFTGLTIYFLRVNDFASETHEIVYPVGGAILLSFYLAYKSIFLSAPAPLVENIPMSMLVDPTKGQFHSLAIIGNSKN